VPHSSDSALLDVVAGVFGKKTKKVLAIDPAEAAVIRRIFDLYLNGEGGRSLGLKAICTKLKPKTSRCATTHSCAAR